VPNVTLVTVERASTIDALDEPTLTALVDVQIAGRLDLATVPMILRYPIVSSWRPCSGRWPRSECDPDL